MYICHMCFNFACLFYFLLEHFTMFHFGSFYNIFCRFHFGSFYNVFCRFHLWQGNFWIMVFTTCISWNYQILLWNIFILMALNFGFYYWYHSLTWFEFNLSVLCSKPCAVSKSLSKLRSGISCHYSERSLFLTLSTKKSFILLFCLVLWFWIIFLLGKMYRSR